MSFIIVSSAIVFPVEFVLSVMLIYHDVKSRGHFYHWGRVVAAFLGACQASSSVTVIALALRSNGDMYWVDMAVRCNLQLLTSTNVRKFMRTLWVC